MKKIANNIIYIRDVSCFIKETKEKHEDVNEIILKSAVVYQFLYIKHFKKAISVKDILELNNYDIGLLGPWNGCLTQLLAKHFGWSEILHSNSILHDAFSRFHDHYSLDRGYSYVLCETRTAKFMKISPLCGQVIGIMYCLIKHIII